ncbi:carbohydrate porin [Sphingomonas sp.]|uniref:carbohydrate porin n=1 Tax=Sphingomonas sp. TaxID=28214 RepID=UPI001EC757F8|nr:carbohydrate porin [Sphingomonas sp.]MBX3594613.1 carbohydrate porin [Sphingomonas sp.]
MALPLLALAIAVAAPQEAQTETHTHRAPPGDTASEPAPPFQLEAVYTAEVIGNVAGGVARGVRYLDNVDVIADADLARIAGWRGARLHLYALYNNGASLGELTGDAQAVSNIETGVRALRLYEMWLDQRIGAGISLRTGLYDLNSEFDSLDSAGLFVSSPHGIGTDFAQSGGNGPSIFPATSLAARIEVAATRDLTFRAAILDGVPGDPARPGRTVIRLRPSDGALIVGEGEMRLGGGKILLGHWRYTARFDRQDGAGQARGNSGSYLRAELPIVQGDGPAITTFARLGVARARFNMFDRFASAGLTVAGLHADRPADQFGIALAAAFTGAPYRAATGAAASEVAIEASYRAPLTPWLAVQPNLHYVRRPSADPAIGDALVLGLRMEFGFSR